MGRSTFPCLIHEPRIAWILVIKAGSIGIYWDYLVGTITLVSMKLKRWPKQRENVWCQAAEEILTLTAKELYIITILTNFHSIKPRSTTNFILTFRVLRMEGS